jgi:murein DD-endopeptidase MepM/ murein hydrolase activator NlpD
VKPRRPLPRPSRPAENTARAILRYLRTDEARWRALVIAGRYTSHIAIIVVVAVAVALAGSSLVRPAPPPAPTPDASDTGLIAPGNAGVDPASVFAQAGGGRLFSLALLQSYGAVVNQDAGVVQRQALPQTVRKTEDRRGIITYTVQPGDTIEGIAARFNILPTTIVWSNTSIEDQPDLLSVGQVLTVLPIDGVYHTVQADDTIEGIAKKFKATADDIRKSPLNNLNAGGNLLIGSRIVVPDGVKPFEAQVVDNNQRSSASGQVIAPRPGQAPVAARGRFVWPARGFISQGYWAFHRALDIANGTGVPIAAADNGVVESAGWSNVGYGYLIVLNHGNGFKTYYAHNSQFFVGVGQAVRQGQTIAAMGSTGRSTGPHLHFEIRLNGTLLNPLVYLP